MKKGFTLIELIITMVLLGIISGLGVNILSNVFSGYADSGDKNFLFNEAKFTFERIEKELRFAVPNSAKADDTVFQYVVFKKAMFYNNIGTKSIKIYDNLTNINLTGEKLSIYNLSPSDIFTSNTNLQKLYTVTSMVENTDKSWTLSLNKDIIADSPYHRCFIVDTPVTVFKEGNKLKRCFDYAINGSNGVNSGKCSILTSYVNSVSFQYEAGNSYKNAILTINLSLQKNGITVNYKHEVQLRNAP